MVTQLSQILQMIGLFLEIVGAYAFAVPLLKTEKEIEKESSTYWDYNLALRKAMIRDKKRAERWLPFLIAGLILQIVSIFV